jgi:hypothetical protein
MRMESFVVSVARLTLFRSPSFLHTLLNARPAGRAFPRAPTDAPLIGPQPMPRFLRTALGTTVHRCLFTLLPCDWPTAAFGFSGLLFGVGTLSSAYGAL